MPRRLSGAGDGPRRRRRARSIVAHAFAAALVCALAVLALGASAPVAAAEPLTTAQEELVERETCTVAYVTESEAYEAEQEHSNATVRMLETSMLDSVEQQKQVTETTAPTLRGDIEAINQELKAPTAGQSTDELLGPAISYMNEIAVAIEHLPTATPQESETRAELRAAAKRVASELLARPAQLAPNGSFEPYLYNLPYWAAPEGQAPTPFVSARTACATAFEKPAFRNALDPILPEDLRGALASRSQQEPNKTLGYLIKHYSERDGTSIAELFRPNTAQLSSQFQKSAEALEGYNRAAIAVAGSSSAVRADLNDANHDAFSADLSAAFESTFSKGFSELAKAVTELDACKALSALGTLASSLVNPASLISLATVGVSVVTMMLGIPSFEELVLKELQEIKELIHKLSLQVSADFTRTDAILDQVKGEIEEVTALLEHVNAHVDALSNGIARLEERLNGLQANLFEIAKTQREEALQADLATDIGYSQRSPGHQPMSVEQFEGAAGVFLTWGDFDPSDAISERQGSALPTSGAEIGEDLRGAGSTDDLDFNLDFLTEFADSASPPWSTEELDHALPNPAVWVDGSLAFSQLLVENPQYATKPLIDDLGTMAERGEELLPTFAAIDKPPATPNTNIVDGVQVETGSNVLNHALGNYLENGEALLSRIEGQENMFLSEKDPGRRADDNCQPCTLGRAAAAISPGDKGSAYINLYGGSEQQNGSGLRRFGTESSGVHQEENGVRTFGTLNSCETGKGEGTLLGAPGDKEDEGGQISIEGSNVANHAPLEESEELLDPLPANYRRLFGNAWHLGLGYMTACYQGWKEDNELTDTVYWYWHSDASGQQTEIFKEQLRESTQVEFEYDGHKHSGSVSVRCDSGDLDARIAELWHKESVYVEGSCQAEEGAGGLVETGGLFHGVPEPSHVSTIFDDLAAGIELADFSEEQSGYGGQELYFPGLSRYHWGLNGSLEEEDYEVPLSLYVVPYPHGALTIAPEVAEEVEAALQTLRREAYIEIAPREDPALSAGGEDVRAAGEALDGSESVLADLVQVGLPSAVVAEPAFEVEKSVGQLLFGPGELLANSPGGYAVYDLFNGEVQREEEGDNGKAPLQSPVVKLNERLKEGARELQDDLSSVEASGQGKPSAVAAGDASIAQTKARLELTEFALQPEGEPVVTTEPASQHVVEPAGATFTAEASGGPEIQWEVSANGYRWEEDTTDAGNSTPKLEVKPTSARENGYQYRARFSNADGTVYCVPATLTVEAQVAPKPNPQLPESETVLEGEAATFDAEASGVPAPSVQWEVRTPGGTWELDHEAGSTTTTLVILHPTASQNGSEYRAVFTNAAGRVESRIARLGVVSAHITKQPASVTVREPRPASFTAEAAGVPNLTVQWERYNRSAGAWEADTEDPGNTTDTLTIEHTQAHESGSLYRARFGDTEGGVTSEPAGLTVRELAHPGLLLLDEQRIKGLGASFTTAELTATKGQEIEYRILAQNTGNVALALKNVHDAGCGNLAGGASELGVGGQATFTCEVKVNDKGNYPNRATAEGVAAPEEEVAAVSATSDEVLVIGPEPEPVVHTGGEGGFAPGQNTAVVEGSVNPKGRTVTSCRFEYGVEVLNQSQPCVISSKGKTTVILSVELRGLKPSTVYQYRLSAGNENGTVHGATKTFKTRAEAAPSAETLPATGVLQRSAVLNASVAPNFGEVSTCRFEYTNHTLFRYASCSEVPEPGGLPVAVAASLTGLAPDTTYSFRISFANLSGGSVQGELETFQTVAALAPTTEITEAAPVGEREAQLNGLVDPNGAPITRCEFKYGSSATALDSSAACKTLPGSGTAKVAVLADVRLLRPDHSYYARLTAVSASGTTASAVAPFQTR